MGGSKFLEGLDGYLNILSIGLPSEKFYNTLSHDTNGLNEYENECKSIFSKTKVFNNKRLCKILLRYLENATKRSQIDYSAYDECILFNYWMYRELSQRYIAKNYPKLVSEFGELNRVWNDLIEGKSKDSYRGKCKPDFEIPYQNDWNERKQLYDYCVNYKSLIGTANNYEQTCKNIYKYIKGKAYLYEHFNKLCTSEKEKECPKFYSECKNYDPNSVLQNLKCHKDMQEEEASPPETAGALSLHTLSNLPQSGTFSPEESQLKGDGTHPATKTGDILLGVVATSLTSGALYRFTPLGRIIRNGLGWNNNNMRNMHGSEYGLFDYAPESFNPYTGGGEEHYIGYQPA